MTGLVNGNKISSWLVIYSYVYICVYIYIYTHNYISYVRIIIYPINNGKFRIQMEALYHIRPYFMGI